MMKSNEILSKVDHTLLNQSATLADIRRICDEAVAHQTASICINPCYVKEAVRYLRGRVPVCTVVGFPLGSCTTATKVFETTKALDDGAEEIDMVINVGELKAKNYDYVLSDIIAVKKACGSKILKVIIETCLLDENEKRKMCELVEKSGADYIKTSTGFSTGGATLEDIKLFHECIGGRVKIKAAGGIKTVDDMVSFINSGADRLGTSSAIKILNSAGIDKVGY